MTTATTHVQGRLDGKVAIVSGAAGGIGLGVARAFSAEGAHVVLADINTAAGEAAAASLPRALFAPCDVGDARQVAALVATTVEAHGRVDVCVNNAGILESGDVLELSEQAFDKVLRVNLKGAFLLSQAAAREMVGSGGGSIINMSSVNAVMTIPTILPYNVSKGGLNQLTRVMAVALAGRKVRVNAIGPGSVMTELLRNNILKDQAALRAVLSRTPMGRFASVDEIAAVALFLASDESSYITGQCIYADGGRMALNYTMPVSDEAVAAQQAALNPE